MTVRHFQDQVQQQKSMLLENSCLLMLQDKQAMIDELRKKVEQHERLRDKAKQMHKVLQDKHALAQCATHIVTSQKYVDYLNMELDKLGHHSAAIQDDMSPVDVPLGPRTSDDEHGSPRARQDPCAGCQVPHCSCQRHAKFTPKSSCSPPVSTENGTNLDLLRADIPISRAKVSMKLHELEYRLSTEMKKYMAYSAAPDKALLMTESKEKLVLLRQALRKYKGLSIGEKDVCSEPPREPPLQERGDTVAEHPVIGTLRLGILEAHALSHRSARLFPTLQTQVVVYVDGVEMQTTRISRDDHWSDTFDIAVHKRAEIEMVVYDQTSHPALPIGLLWLKMPDITEVLRREKRKQRHQDWLVGQKTTEATEPTPDQLLATNASDVTLLTSRITDWFDIEPMGKLKLHIEFVRKPTKKRPFDKLRRADVFREERKRSVRHTRGHAFVPRRYYQILRCALCSDFMVSTVYQCQHCRIACHKQCYSAVVSGCVGSDARITDNTVLNHRIPHRFESLVTRSSGWCSHCGFMLPWGLHVATKCSECSLTCHAKCAPFVPEFCGLSLEKAHQIFNELKVASERRRSSLLTQTVSDRSIDQLSPTSINRYSYASLPISLPQTPTTPQPTSQRTIFPPLSPRTDDKGGHRRISEPSPYASTTPVHLHGCVGIDDFNFVAVLGRGNFGKVMLAENKYTNELYAVKIQKKKSLLRSQDIGGFNVEKRVFVLANRDRHPFLVHLHSTFTTESRIFFVMEYVPGGDLLTHLQHQGLSEQKARFYSCETLLALEYLHTQGVLYRDLKLDNILVCADGHIKLADYGLCKDRMTANSKTNTFCGTPEFMAPEMILDKPYTRAVDWWAFGVLVYEMMLGEAPFKGDDDDELYNAIVRDEVLFPPGMSDAAMSLCRQLLAKNPRERLGAGERDAAEVQCHAFYEGVQWQDLLAKRIMPPYIPNLTSRADTSNFDAEFTGEFPVLTPVTSTLTGSEQEVFSDFCYISDWALGHGPKTQTR